ncbi:hypothetical protein ACWCQW_46840 [Streptomyces mirabilis]
MKEFGRPGVKCEAVVACPGTRVSGDGWFSGSGRGCVSPGFAGFAA